MMKKIFALVFALIVVKCSFSQGYPLQQNLGSDSTIVISKGATQSRFVNIVFTDTTQANTQRIKNYPGAQIATNGGGIKLWLRNQTATAWIPVNTGSGSNIYTIDGTLTGNRTLTGGGYPLTFTGLDKFVVSADSVRFTTGALNLLLRTDSASITKKLSYAGNYHNDYKQFTLVDKGYVDSVVASSPAGTVTSIATNNGSGITGGTITSTGTLAIDTLLVSTRAWRQKGIDSVAALINSNISGTTNYVSKFTGANTIGNSQIIDDTNVLINRTSSFSAGNYTSQKLQVTGGIGINSSQFDNAARLTLLGNSSMGDATIDWGGTGNFNLLLTNNNSERMRIASSGNVGIGTNAPDSMLTVAQGVNLRRGVRVSGIPQAPGTKALRIDASGNVSYADTLIDAGGTVTSVGLTMPAAFNVGNSPITTAGTISVTAAGLVSQYIRGDGTLADFPGGGGGGGASISYYLNGSVNQGTFGGNTYYEMNKTPIFGTGTNFSINADGYIAQFITDAGDPGLLKIPGGNWNFELFFNASSGGGNPTYYVELYKYDGTTFTLIASGSTNPDVITGGTAVEAYFSTLPVPETVLLATDRLAVRIYVTHAGRTITLHTEDNNLCQVITTFTTGITALNGLTEQVQYFTTGTSGTDFNISSSVATHTFNLPTASATNRGALSTTDWTTFNNKVGGSLISGYIPKATGTNTIDTSQLFQNGQNVGIGTLTPNGRLAIVDTGGFALKINYNSASNVSDSNAAIYAENNGLSSYVAIFNEKTTNNTGAQLPLLIESSLTTGTPQANMGTGMDFGTRDDANNRKLNRFIIRGTDPAAATYTSRAEFRLWNNGVQTTPYYWLGNGNMGLGTSTPDSNLTVVNGAYFQRGIRASGLPAAPGTKALRVDASGTISIADTLTNGVSGSGTTNYVSKFTGTNTIGNSLVFDNGTSVGIGTTTPTGSGLEVFSDAVGGRLRLSRDAGTAKGSLQFGRNNGGSFQETSRISGAADNASVNNGSMTFLTSDNAGSLQVRMTLESDGDVSVANKLGVGTLTGDSALTVTNGTHLQRGVRMSGLPSAPGTRALRVDANGTLSVSDTLTNGISGSGTTNYIPKFTSSSAIGNSLLQETGTNVTLENNQNGSTWLIVKNTNAGNGAASGLLMTNNGGDFGAISLLSSTNSPANALFIRTLSTNSLVFGTNSNPRMTLDASGNLGLGVTPSAWLAGTKALQVANIGLFEDGGNNAYLTSNAFFDGSWKYIASDWAMRYEQVNGQHAWYNAPSGTAGNAISFTQAMTLNASGNLGLGVTPSAWNTSYKAIQISNRLALSGTSTESLLGNNWFQNTSGSSIYLETAAATLYRQVTGEHQWFNAPSGTAGTGINFTQAMTLDASGNLGIGTTVPASLLSVGGAGYSGRALTVTGSTAATYAATIQQSNATGLGLQIYTTNTSWGGDPINISDGAGNTQLRMNSSGNVGIGTTSLFGLLNLQSGTNARWEFSSGASATLELLNNARNAYVDFNVYANNYIFNRLGAESMRIDASGNLGLGVTPSAWGSQVTALQLPQAVSLYAWNASAVPQMYLGANNYFDGSNFKYTITGQAATLYYQASGQHIWYNAPSGTAGNNISLTQAMTLDASGNLGLGVTPSAWGVVKAFQIERSALSSYSDATPNAGTQLTTNAYYDGSNWRYIANIGSSQYDQLTSGGGAHRWFTAPSGTAGNAITFTQAMTLDADGDLGIGVTNPSSRLHISTDGSSALRMVRTGGVTDFGFEFGGGQIGLYDYTNSAYRWFVNSAGNVGIGTTSPGSFQAAANNLVVGTGSGYEGITLYGGTTGGGSLYFADGTASTDGYRGYIEYDHTNDYMTFGTAALFAMRINSSGNVGIGTTSPTYKLQAEVSSANVAYFNRLTTDGDIMTLAVGGTNAFVFNTTSGVRNIQAPGAVDLTFATNSSERMRITSGGNVGIGTISPVTFGTRNLDVNAGSGGSAYIVARANSNGGTVELAFDTDAGYLSTKSNHPLIVRTNDTERMRITSGGEVYIGNNPADQGAYNLQVNGTGVWGAGAYVNGSDSALKYNIQPLEPSLDIVKQMKPVTFEYQPFYSKDTATQTGFIAQDLQRLLADKVYKNGIVKEGGAYLGVAYENIIPLLVKAIQEQQTQIDQLKAQLNNR